MTTHMQTTVYKPIFLVMSTHNVRDALEKSMGSVIVYENNVPNQVTLEKEDFVFFTPSILDDNDSVYMQLEAMIASVEPEAILCIDEGSYSLITMTRMVNKDTGDSFTILQNDINKPIPMIEHGFCPVTNKNTFLLNLIYSGDTVRYNKIMGYLYKIKFKYGRT